jgi:hypothetical protein
LKKTKSIDIDHVSDVSVKHWLKVRELPHSAVNNEDLKRLLAKLVETGNLEADVLATGIREIEEAGSKTISLRITDKPESFSDRAKFARHLASLGLGLTPYATGSVKLPKKPTLNYATWSKSEVRIKFSEKQIQRNPNYETVKL